MGEGLNGHHYYVVDHKNEVVFESADFHEARGRLHKCKDGSRLIRGDGAILAFMASTGSAKVRKRLPPGMKDLLQASAN